MKKRDTWYGSREGLASLLIWVRRTYGKPTECVKCGAIKGVQWYNKDKKYGLERKDWRQICDVCYKKAIHKYKNKPFP